MVEQPKWILAATRLCVAFDAVSRPYGKDAAPPMGREKSVVSLLPEVLSAATPIEYLDSLAMRMAEIGAYGLAVPVCCEVIKRLAADSARKEMRAYFFNDLAMFLLAAGDPRCIECGLKALRLNTDSGRRVRILGRMGEFYCVAYRDWTRAAKHYGAALRLGEATNYDPGKLHWVRERLFELELDRQGLSQLFESRRQEMQVMSTAYADLLRETVVPGL